MNKINQIGILFLLLLFNITIGCKGTKKINTEEKEMKTKIDLSMYPKPAKGYHLVYIQVEPKENESELKLELHGGIIKIVDCNRQSLTGEFETLNLKGWGYTYYKFNTNGLIMSTKMACPEGSEHKAFVKSQGLLINYNSRMPRVIYMPNGYEIRYSIWERNQDFKKATKY